VDEITLKKKFEERKGYLQKYGEWVVNFVLGELYKKLESKANVDKFLKIYPTPRVKDTDSFLEKALVRKPKSDPLHDITDQVGVRFVVLLLKDIDCVGTIIKKGPWDCQKDRDFEQERLNKPDYFSYQSDHYVIRLKNDLSISETIVPCGTPCEIQIRTLLQHAYAEMAHDIDYKPSIHLPEDDRKFIRRSLAKGSALIETTDDIFCDIKNTLDEYDFNIHKLLETSSTIYTNITSEHSSPCTQIGLIVTDIYRELLKTIMPIDLQNWADNNFTMLSILKSKRNESVFYRDSIVILLGYLVFNYQTTIPLKWPLEMKYLEEFYGLIGISTDGLF
jgi:ppGpp synthetase/RelA/SpoT-type nucleotidyltranferase